MTMKQAPGGLPKLTASEVEERMVAMLQELGDLSVYIASVAGGKVVTENFCVQLPQPLAPRVALSTERFERAVDSLRALNASLGAYEPLTVSQRMGACLNHENFVV